MIPKQLQFLKQSWNSEFTDEVEAIVDGKMIILSAKKKVREGWSELFDDAPLEADLQDWLGVENEFERENQW